MCKDCERVIGELVLDLEASLALAQAFLKLRNDPPASQLLTLLVVDPLRTPPDKGS